MKGFDFNEVGKRLPYSVPEGFFDEARRNAKAVGMKPQASRTKAVLYWSFAAATVAVLLVSSIVGMFSDKDKVLMYRYETLLAKASTEEVVDIAAGYAAGFNEPFTDF